MNHTATDQMEGCIKACQKLLRGELSAVETYNQALEKFADSQDGWELHRIRSEHQLSADALRNHLTEMGVLPDWDTGAWGTFAKVVEGAALLFGETPALQVLKEGEELGISGYDEALSNADVMPEAKIIIRETLRPRLMDHLFALERLTGNPPKGDAPAEE